MDSLPEGVRYGTQQQTDVGTSGLGEIFFGLSNWSPEAQGAPYLKATQFLHHGGFRDLAAFDVYSEPGT